MNINLIELKDKGYTIVKDLVDEIWINKLQNALNEDFLKHKLKFTSEKIQIEDGVVLHILIENPLYLDFLQFLCDKNFFLSLSNNFFKSNCIINSFSALNNLPNQPNFSSKIHRDLRFYSGEFPVMLNCLIMIDDFTLENGGTYLLPFSHLKEEKPNEFEFYSKSEQAIGKKGDALIFNSNLWHASAPNKTNTGRKAIPITISRSFMKQLLDYPRAIGYDRIDDFSFELQQLLGYHSRVPASLNEWYQPENKRFYKKDQD